MPIRDLLLSELEIEAAKTRKTLDRVPGEQAGFTPHPKSMPLGKLAAHVAQLGGFGVPILSAPQLDFATSGMKPLAFESAEQLVGAFNAGLEPVRQILGKLDDSAWQDSWTLRRGEQVFFTGSRFVAYRSMYVNHMLHHRAQLGVYLRLLNLPVPAIYGPSADEAIAPL